MRLIRLKIEARGAEGWQSPALAFGSRITSLFAKNGSGKTPLIQAIVFCLGYPVKFREDINDKCEAVLLTVQLAFQTITIRRVIGRDFEAYIVDELGSSTEYLTEKEFSNALLALIGLNPPKLVSSNKQETHPYMATVLPLFYMDQDHGYSEVYHPPSKFISDQFVEMIRFCFGLAPKHSFVAKSDLIRAKSELETVDRRIVLQLKVIDDFARNLDSRPERKNELSRRNDQIKVQLSELKDSVKSKDVATIILEDMVRGKQQVIGKIRQQISELNERISGISSIRSEIETEIDTLSLNEESRRVFESFKDICANKNCGLFVSSQDSYAKNLLYLKDQIKDLERNADRASDRSDELTKLLQLQEADLAALTARMQSQGTSAEIGQLVAVIQQLTHDLFENEQAQSTYAILDSERDKHFRLSRDRDALLDRISNLTSAGRSDFVFNKLRTELRQLIVKWLDILETKNVSRDVDIDLEFKFRFGKEPLDAIKGSTKIRTVLAIHAAIFERYLSVATNGIRIFILDTPKQHEMHTKDLARYLAALGDLCRQSNGQIVFSSTEYRFGIDSDDVEWLPGYRTKKNMMYLGPLPTKSKQKAK